MLIKTNMFITCIDGLVITQNNLRVQLNKKNQVDENICLVILPILDIPYDDNFYHVILFFFFSYFPK